MVPELLVGFEVLINHEMSGISCGVNPYLVHLCLQASDKEALRRLGRIDRKWTSGSLWYEEEWNTGNVWNCWEEYSDFLGGAVEQCDRSLSSPHWWTQWSTLFTWPSQVCWQLYHGQPQCVLTTILQSSHISISAVLASGEKVFQRLEVVRTQTFEMFKDCPYWCEKCYRASESWTNTWKCSCSSIRNSTGISSQWRYLLPQVWIWKTLCECKKYCPHLQVSKALKYFLWIESIETLNFLQIW